MSDKLNELAKFLGDKISQLEGLKIEQPTLKEIQLDADDFFKDKDYTERQRRVYTEALLSDKIVELEKTIVILQNQLIK